MMGMLRYKQSQTQLDVMFDSRVYSELFCVFFSLCSLLITTTNK
jgi:hypothetical protein